MTVSQITDLLNARVLCGTDQLGIEITQAFGADMMSDVLAFVREGTVLLTGLVNAHVIRTAEMLDLRCIVFVRGKDVPEEILQMARDLNLVVLTTEKTLYVTCGILYAHGLPGCLRA